MENQSQKQLQQGAKLVEVRFGLASELQKIEHFPEKFVVKLVFAQDKDVICDTHGVSQPNTLSGFNETSPLLYIGKTLSVCLQGRLEGNYPNTPELSIPESGHIIAYRFTDGSFLNVCGGLYWGMPH